MTVKKLNKKGVFNDITALLISLATIAIVLTVTFLILAQAGEQAATIEGGDNLTDCTGYACNSTKTTQGAMSQIPDWLDIIVIVVIGAIILGLVKLFRRSG